MNVVVDSNVIVYYLFGTEPFVEETRRFWRVVGRPVAPAVWAAEVANATWMAVRSGILAAIEGHRRLDLAGRLGVQSVPIRTLWQGALARSLATETAVYDTLFVELAIRQRLPLVTFDNKLLKTFPDIAVRPGQLLP